MAPKKETPATKEDVRALRTEIEGVDQRLIQVEKRLKTLATKDDLKQFATKNDLKQFATKNDLHALEKRMDDKFATKDQLALVLEIVRSIDQHLKEQGNLPERVTVLEEDVAELTLRR